MMDLFHKPTTPDHPVWHALEDHFRVRLSQDERQQIVGLIRNTIAHRPDVDLNALAIGVTRSVLGQRVQPG
ncbi:MAG: hypothetical protein IT285_11240 [Bdellovibrionales bacterium]|nr:hypothetical protein [Bdellovibrionales bacterium]